MSPVVPRYNGPQIATAPLPGVRVSTNAPSAAFGVPAVIDTSGVEHMVQRIVDEERDKADAVHINAADANLYDVRTQLESEGLKRRGLDAMGATGDALHGFRKATTEIEAGLTSERQRLIFQHRAMEHWASLHTTLERHADAQSREYDADSTKAIMDGASNEALKHVDDPAIVAVQIEKQQAALADFLNRNGVRGEVAQQRLREQASMTHASVVNHLLNLGQDLSAANYFTKHRDELVGADLLTTEKLVDTGSLRAESQRQADGITAKAPSFGAARDAAMAITDPRVRDETLARVRRYYEDTAADERMAQAQAFHDASSILERTGSFDRIPIALRVKMSPQENEALQHREDQLRHPKRETKLDVYNTLLNMAGLNAASRQDFEKLNLLEFRDQLSEEDFHSLTREQLSLRLGTMTGEVRATRKAADRDAAIETLRQMGVEVAPSAPVPGAPLRPPAATPPPNDAIAGATTRGSVPQIVPRSWVQRAQTDKRYRGYLEHMGVHVPDGTGSIEFGASATTRSTP